jgi:signal transduction histidine kinase
VFRSEEGSTGFHHHLTVTGFGEDGRLLPSAEWLVELLASHTVSSCVIEVLRDSGRADYRLLAASPAFEKTTGLHEAIGHSMRELRPDHEEFWFDLYARVAASGEPASFEHVAAALERRFRGHAFRLGGAHSSQVVVILEVTTGGGEAGLERFSATLAHELRSPLASMRNGLQGIKNLLPEGRDGQWTVNMMDRQLLRLSGLIDDMLDIGRLGSTDVRLQRETVDLHHVVSESIEACGTAVDAKRHEVSIDSDGVSLQVRADVRRMVQVFTNLLTNSIKYTAAGGHIRFRLYREGGMAVVEVQDDGMCIRAEELPGVFDLFNQGPMNRPQAEGGLGIGLSIVRSIVRLHEGTVAAHSEGKGKGSTFTVRIPLAP